MDFNEKLLLIVEKIIGKRPLSVKHNFRLIREHGF